MQTNDNTGNIDNVLSQVKQIISDNIVYDLKFSIVTSCNGIVLKHRDIFVSDITLEDETVITYKFVLEGHPLKDEFKLGRIKTKKEEKG